MADRIVQPKVLNEDGTYSNLIMENAIYARYASSDTSKGTIEERLTRLGFKQGTLSLSNITPSEGVIINKITRIGNLVSIEFKWTGEITTSSLPQYTIPIQFRNEKSFTSVGTAYIKWDATIGNGTLFEQTFIGATTNIDTSGNLTITPNIALTMIKLYEIAFTLVYDAKPLT